METAVIDTPTYLASPSASVATPEIVSGGGASQLRPPAWAPRQLSASHPVVTAAA